jgi:dienelactone hydrolase
MTVTVEAGSARLVGDLEIPEGARGVVAFAHGTGSSRLSPRNQHVARGLRDRGLGTLLLDLLTESEEAEDMATGHLRFDVALLGDRMIAAVDALVEGTAAGLPVGLFGASTGAAAALVAAAERPDAVRAVVSRGGRPDLAEEHLPRVLCPTLLIVGQMDERVLELNRHARDRLRPEAGLEIVAGASHLFEEPGALDEVVRLAGEWFVRHLPGRAEPSRKPGPA